ncbi:hypothetical protein L6452_05113 [Arctium lappa]|uniref:Uncharacterized protein n=1 Tax=Arctium lappa TaxID=4217 RepID=A0ACB9EGJ9_ARCLA|nr:hypothetical protein L6452_05113 [Arctium lappa]
MTPSKNYRDAYDDVDEEFSTVILPQDDNIMPRVDPLDLGKESRDDYFRTDCRDISPMAKAKISVQICVNAYTVLDKHTVISSS